MTLRLPDKARDRYPAVVIVHTIAGYQEANEGWHADQFRKAGFATLTYESPTARSMLQGASGSRGASWASGVAEAYSALRVLAADPRIDASRIAIVGFSFGGEVAILPPSNDCVPRSPRDKPGLPPTSPTIRRASMASLRNPRPIRARRS